CPAGQASGTDVITFSLPGGATITAATPLPVIIGGLAIEGPGAGVLTISGGNSTSLIWVEPTGTASISGLTLTEGHCSSGCAVQNRGSLTLEHVAIRVNKAETSGAASNFAMGGAIFNDGTLTLRESAVEGNAVLAGGGSSQNRPDGG